MEINAENRFFVEYLIYVEQGASLLPKVTIVCPFHYLSISYVSLYCCYKVSTNACSPEYIKKFGGNQI